MVVDDQESPELAGPTAPSWPEVTTHRGSESLELSYLAARKIWISFSWAKAQAWSSRMNLVVVFTEEVVSVEV